MSSVAISVIVPVVEKYGDLAVLYEEFSAEFDKLGTTYEFIFVLDAAAAEAFEMLKEIKAGGAPIKVIKLAKHFGESTAISVGFEKSQGDYVFLVSPYLDIAASSVETIWRELEGGKDLVLGWRHPRIDSRLNRLETRLFHWFIRQGTSLTFHDVSSGLKGMKRAVLEEINLYGGLYRFIPVLADRRGFTVAEVQVPQRERKRSLRLVGLGYYIRRLLDVLIILFIAKFTMKPLRFFGGIAAALIAVGGSITGYLGVYRILGYGAIAQRPLLLLGVLVMALGVQTLSMGLIAELIIFVHARRLHEYRVEEFLE